MLTGVVLKVPKEFRPLDTYPSNWVDLRLVPEGERDVALEMYDCVIADEDDNDTALCGMMGAFVTSPGKVSALATIRVEPDRLPELLAWVEVNRNSLVQDRILHPFAVKPAN